MPDKVYTGKGDDGTTQLFYAGRERVAKSSVRVNAYGEADEAVSALGVARALAIESGQDDVAEIVLRLQRELFVLNAELATEPENWERLQPGTGLVTTEMTEALAATIDSLEESFDRPQDFIVPGNTPLGASLDHATRVVRRAERAIDALARAESVRGEAVAYINRFADLIWVLARYAEREVQQPRPRGD